MNDKDQTEPSATAPISFFEQPGVVVEKLPVGGVPVGIKQVTNTAVGIGGAYGSWGESYDNAALVKRIEERLGEPLKDECPHGPQPARLLSPPPHRQADGRGVPAGGDRSRRALAAARRAGMRLGARRSPGCAHRLQRTDLHRLHRAHRPRRGHPRERHQGQRAQSLRRLSRRPAPGAQPRPGSAKSGESQPGGGIAWQEGAGGRHRRLEPLHRRIQRHQRPAVLRQWRWRDRPGARREHAVPGGRDGRSVR